MPKPHPICPMCKINSKTKRHSGATYQSYCKECNNKLMRNHYNKNIDVCREVHRRHSKHSAEVMSNNYIKKQLHKKFKTRFPWPQELITTKRIQLSLHREIRRQENA